MPLLIGALRPTPVTITTTVMRLEADCRAMSDMVCILNTLEESGAFRGGTCGAAAIDRLEASRDRIDRVDSKVGFNAFANTRLHDLLVARHP